MATPRPRGLPAPSPATAARLSARREVEEPGPAAPPPAPAAPPAEAGRAPSRSANGSFVALRARVVGLLHTHVRGVADRCARCRRPWPCTLVVLADTNLAFVGDLAEAEPR
jgi:hypothetical protein